MEVAWNRLRKCSGDLPSRIELVLVDDHSPNPGEIPEDIRERFPHQVIRVTEDVPWNQMTARNIGAEEARGSALMFLDPDMVPPKFGEFWYHAQDLKHREVLRFCIKKPDHEVDLTSPNCWILSKELWEEIGGYNEGYRGNKGWSDVELLQVMTYWPDIKLRQDKDLFVDYLQPEDGYEDARVPSSSGVDRNVGVNKKKHLINNREVQRRYRGDWARWWMDRKSNQKFLTTKYEVLRKS